MNVIITVEEEFKRQAKKLAKKYHSISDDLLELQERLKANPLQLILILAFIIFLLL